MLRTICKAEGLTVDDKAKEAIFILSKGDARKYENILQSCSSVKKTINLDLVYEVASAAKPEEIKEVINLALQGGFAKSRDLLLKTMLKHGLSGVDIIKQIQQEILELNIEDKRKVELIKECGEIEFRLVEGSDEFIQLCALLASFSES